MENINNNDIHIISRHSNWSTTSVDDVLHSKIYSKKADWTHFLKLLFISLGVAFTTAGIIFFFAYNWNDLHKFIKLGLIGSLIIGLTLFVAFSKNSQTIKNVILTGVTMLVGVLFAVFGQIYQTGANAYDFFLGWTMAVALWVFISNFSAMWLVFMVLANITLVLYEKQVAHDWSPLTLLLLLILLNTVFLIGNFILSKKDKQYVWLQKIVAIAIVTLATFGVVVIIFDVDLAYNWPLLLVTIVLYIIGRFYAFNTKDTFYIAIIALSIIVILVALFLKVFDFDSGVLLLASLLVIAFVTVVVKYLMKLQKNWDNE
ncbi:MAG: DUF2157 domain-containing protein [Flavobacteriaceae bacterium]